MKSLKYILFLLLILIIGFCIYVAVQPGSFEVERTRTINAPAQVVFNEVMDFKTWPSWSAWAEADPEMTFKYNDQTSGIGASYSWEDDDGVGVGTMTTLSANKPTDIQQEMQIGDYPKSDISWKFTPQKNGSTDVTWKISGKDLPFGFKAFAVLTGGMEKEIGPNYERSLEKLDSLIQVDMKRYNIKINGITEYGGGFFLYKTTNANSTNISAKMGENFGAIMQFMGNQKLKQSGMPLTVYNEMGESIIMSNGIPIKERIEIPEDSDISMGYIPKTKVLKTTLTGNYTNLSEAWGLTMKNIVEKGLEQSEIKPFEIYTNDPGNYPNPADWKTEIYIPLKQ